MRLDLFLSVNGYAETRTKAQELIKSGAVTVNGKNVSKASFDVTDADVIECSIDLVCPYVSRGGLKLQAALDEFDVDVNEAVCLDIGASSGGFTDCLLKRGAKRVYAVDSGSGQLHPSLCGDERVISLENLNARYISDKQIPEKIDIAVMDVSFISQTKLYQAIIPLLKEKAVLLTLIKPQFEVGRGGVGKGGIVRDPKKRKEAVDNVLDFASCVGLQALGVIESPIKGGDGNTEYLAHLRLR